MKTLTIQIISGTRWVDAAQLTLLQPEKGSASAARLGYQLDYALQWIERDDEHACSLTLPVQLLVEHEAARWFGFLDDIVPAGAARRYWVNQLALQDTPPGIQSTRLLEHATIAPVGNLRIKESLPALPAEPALHSRRFPVTDVVERNTDFLEYAQQMGAISGGATGAGGEAPKLLLRCSAANEVWIDTYQHDFTLPDQYFLVKFPRNNRTDDDCDILRAEYHFYHELTALGVNTIDTEHMMLQEGERFPSLWLPRFDVHWHNNSWQRYGLESVFSVLHKPAGSYLNHFDVLAELCRLLKKRQASFDCHAFVCEWVKRDLLNIAFGNSDNHGRNTALLKKPDHIWLSPVYDFAPMKADPAGIPRTTTWGAPFEIGGEYRWQQIAGKLAEAALCPAEKTLDTLKETAARLEGLKGRLIERGVPARIINMPVMGFDYLEQKLARWGLL